MCVCVFSQLFQALGHFITKPIITQLSVSLIRGEDTGALNSYVPGFISHYISRYCEAVKSLCNC